LQTVRHCFNIYTSSCVALALYMTQSWAPQTRYTFQRNTVSIMKYIVWRSAYSSMKCHGIFETTIKQQNVRKRKSYFYKHSVYKHANCQS